MLIVLDNDSDSDSGSDSDSAATVTVTVTETAKQFTLSRCKTLDKYKFLFFFQEMMVEMMSHQWNEVNDSRSLVTE